MNSPISVSTLNTQIKSLLETTFINVYVEGEISNLTYHNSGHIYFSIKDENSTISCVMFKGNTKYLKFQLEVGLKVVITGTITVYTPRGSYQLLCNKIEPSGQGALALAYEQLKAKLHAKGYFNPEIKKTLPKYPKKIALVTSPTGAAIEDMKKVASHRWPLIELVLIPTLVQGDEAKFDIVSSIKFAQTLDVDLIVVGRGGGSVEDLWSFNEEIVATAIYECQKPIISAVGHEIDFLISDFVADIRAATPSNAMEIALPDINEHRIYIDTLSNDFQNRLKNQLLQKQTQLENITKLFEQNSLKSKFNYIQEEISLLKKNFQIYIKNVLQMKQNSLNVLQETYKSNHPDKKNLEGYAQVTMDNKITKLEELKIDDIITLQSSKTLVSCRVTNIKKQ
ncbi:exodeoxyribonuclease VII large subunit [Halarcobacter ebronensis]|uniref:Exodeoxyribonuclease 7 large subunit n=1 Tax=Halarcobacter ebronensis TaxID=1462615 RepID=A0A4Q1AMF4_9BACT|nr:exodeoxyribonuclease VII large subunit [Halarcobacter ebronensis]QKF81132.1 exodeoxyribonuclease VII, large subunit [Halarcobacter ebronensis]RXK06435.1 exodeoxyribonuclease VII large subunit [Halarcobacter ebronensis]